MRRRTFFISLLLLCALALSGWGVVLAATLCPHAARAASKMVPAEPMVKDHSSCHAQGDAANAQNSTRTHEAMSDMEAMPGTEDEPPAVTRFAEGCRPCCVSRGNLPTAPASPLEPLQNGREKQLAATQDIKTIASTVMRFAPTVVPTQGSPPGQLTRLHLLLSVFLI